MPHIIRSVERARKRDNSYNTLVRTSSGPVKSRKGIRLIHGKSGMLFEGKQIKNKNEYTMLLNTSGVTPEAGDELYELKEGWQPALSPCTPDECFEKYNWCLDTHAKASVQGGVVLNDIRIHETLYNNIEAYIGKYSCTEEGCSIRRCLQKVPVPQFILDIYLESQHRLYCREGKIYQKDFDYRKVLSPFTANILNTVETEQYIHMKEFSRMKNADISLRNLESLGYIVIYNELYILPRSRAGEIPHIVHEARIADPDISLSTLAEVAGVPKKVLLLILQHNE